MLETQKFIKEHGVLALANEPLNIKVREYPEQGYYMLNYDQIASPKNNPITMECRSLLVDAEGNIISRKFDRFFNHGEMPEFYQDFEINRAKVFEKADGSLVGIYFSPKTSQWEISTRSLAFAEGDHLLGGTFRDRILYAMNFTEEQFQETFNKVGVLQMTYIMEYIGPDNRVVTPYQKSELVMLAIRNNKTGEYVDDPSLFVGHVKNEYNMNIRMAHCYTLDSFDDIIKAAKELPTLTEGYVCYDPVSNKRVKIKNPAYVAVHHLRENGTPSIKRIYSLVLMNEHEEYLDYFPDDKELFSPVIQSVSEYKEMLVSEWEKVKDIEDQKTFALSIKHINGNGFFFKAKKSNMTALHAFETAEIDQQIKVFNLKGD